MPSVCRGCGALTPMQPIAMAAVSLQEAYGKLQEWTVCSEAAARKLATRAGALQSAMQVWNGLLAVHALPVPGESACIRTVALCSVAVFGAAGLAQVAATVCCLAHVHTFQWLLRDLLVACHSLLLQNISSQAQASAAAEDNRAAVGGNSAKRVNSPLNAASAAAGGTVCSASVSTAATNEVMDQLAGLQQLVQAEAHKQQEVFDNTLKVILRGFAGAALVSCAVAQDLSKRRGTPSAADNSQGL